MEASHQTVTEDIQSEISSDSACDSGSDYADSLFSVDCGSSMLSVLGANPVSGLDNSYHRMHHERRYQGFREGKWTIPDDEQEQDRMQIVDQIMSILLNGELYISPLQNPHRILDVGTGTGVWAADVADKFPNARVIGTDLSPIQVPPPANCRFEIEDADEEWIYPENYFSMVHTRHLAGGIRNWSLFFAESFRTLHPNGWAELAETPYILHSENPDISPDLPIMRASRLWRQAKEKTGYPVGSIVNSFAELMQNAGFVDVAETWHRLPVGPWSTDSSEKEVGRLNMLNALEGMESFILDPFIRVYGMSVEQVRSICEECRLNALSRRNQLYTNLLVIRGRKPAVGEVVSSST